MNRNFAEKQLTLNYNAAYVKQCLNQVLAAGKTTYMSPTANEILGTYNFIMTRGIGAGAKIQITVNDKAEDKTDFQINIKNLADSRASDNLLESIMDDFLKVFSLALSGQTVTNTTVQQNTAGCMGMVLAIVILSAFAAITLLNI